MATQKTEGFNALPAQTRLLLLIAHCSEGIDFDVMHPDLKAIFDEVSQQFGEALQENPDLVLEQFRFYKQIGGIHLTWELNVEDEAREATDEEESLFLFNRIMALIEAA